MPSRRGVISSEERFSFIFSDDDYERDRSSCLIAGDSNVHRLKSVVGGRTDWQWLPISGARFVRDTKGFRKLLQRKLHETRFDSLYLHLGSNDVLCNEETFYKNVTEMCDFVHGISPSTVISLCEILPRGPDTRRGVTEPPRRVALFKGWIKRANDLLWEMCHHVPYIRFLSYGRTSQVAHYVSHDGLHLSWDGAELCCQALSNDYEMHACPKYALPDFEVSCTAEDWPLLQSTVQLDAMPVDEVQGQEEILRKQYAEILKELPDVLDNHQMDSNTKRAGLGKRKEKQRDIRVTSRKPRRKRRHFKKVRKQNKKSIPKLHPRSLHHPIDFVRIETMDDVEVEVRASLIQGSFLKNNRFPVPVGLREDHAKKQRLNRTVKKDRSVTQWLPCPECKVRCSREDFLLDHIIRRHVTQKFESTTDSIKETDTLISDDNIPRDQQYSETYIELPSGEDLYYVFPPSVWWILMQLAAIDFLCGPEGMHHVIMSLLIQQHVDTTELRLLLSGDVEQHPGPMYKCNWQHCSEILCSPGNLKVHVAEHVREDKQCRWIGCSGCLITDFELLVGHAVKHLFQHEEYFTSLEDWFRFLPENKYDDRTNLQNCPRHLRSKLQLVLLDEDFHMTSHPYTVGDHKAYVNRMSILYPTKFNQLVSEFLQKRENMGEKWSNTQEICKLHNTSTNTPKPFYNVACRKDFDFVTTQRAELGAKSFSGTLLKSIPRKRKHSEAFCNSNINENTWLNNLTNNLSSCNDAISLQKSILHTMFENSLVTASKQCLFKIEQEAARLASIDQCTNGSFACTVFKCCFDEKEIIYIRYVESGVYSGFMLQRYISLLKEKYNFTDDSVLLHNVLTSEDIDGMRTDNSKAEVKRRRPERLFKYACKNVLQQEVNNLMEFAECSEIKLDSFVVHCLPFRSKVTVDNPEQMFLEGKNVPVNDTKSLFSDFRINQLDARNTVKISSMDILNDPSSTKKTLLQQSITLNCMSGDIKRKPALFKRKPRFESNFIHSSNLYTGTSLRNVTSLLYLQKNFQTLYSFFQNYFPGLNESNNFNSDFQIPNVTPVCKKKKATRSVKRLIVTKQDLEKQLPSSISEPIQEAPVDIYKNYCCSLLEHGKFSIRDVDESGLLVCCMNDYSETDGSFKDNDFVCTIKETQETGDYFYCSCKIYRTLITLQECKNVNEEFLVLDSEGENCVTCIHCTYLKKTVLPELEKGNMCETKLQGFLQKAMNDKGKDIVELSRNNGTCKYSILAEDEDRPSFVHLSYNKRLNNYVVSCLNSKCVILKGHKRSVSTLLSSNVCKHLSVFKTHTEYWEELLTNYGNQSTGEVIDLENVDSSSGMKSSDLISESLSSSSEFEKENFNTDTGLWQFTCKSTHSPNKKDSSLFKLNVLKRDNWNDDNLNRLSDGCLKGPTFFPDIPDNTCECGCGWLKRDDHEDVDGRTVHEKSRVLTVYTLIAPVKCDIHSRICYNAERPCKLLWDEGSLESLHVYSNETAAGDEIGWEFVGLVINSGCTFASFCQMKNNFYKFRDSRAKFMHPTVFVKWWFSWAANMKIDFREACDVCGFEPKRLCCDGTRVGVGFRHATFEEINKSDPNDTVQSTLHRRMDRCFLKNMDGVTTQQTIANRETLNYLARQEMGELVEKERLSPEELNVKLNCVKEILPEAILPSFERFFTMAGTEKLAFAFVLKMLSTTASVTSLLPPSFCAKLQQLVSNPDLNSNHFHSTIQEMRSYAPELRDLICESILCNNRILPDDIRLFIQYLANESLSIDGIDPEAVFPQPDSYNPARFGRAYYFNKFGLKLRNVRKFTIDNDNNAKRNVDHDDNALEFERCQKLYSKIQNSAPGTSTLFLWFCADHGHCYGFHMTGAEGRKDPAASLYTYLEKPPQDIFYDFACNLQEYCLNRESGFYKNVRFFHDIFHSYAHKCSVAFKSNRLQGFESVNSEICEQFNSFIQCIKKSARQMSQTHFCFYLQFFLHEWNERKRILCQKKIRVALAGLVNQ